VARQPTEVGQLLVQFDTNENILKIRSPVL